VARGLSLGLPSSSNLNPGPATEARILARVASPPRNLLPRRLIAAAVACLLALAAAGVGYQLGRLNPPDTGAGPRLAGTPQEQAIALDVIDSSKTTSRVLRSTESSPAYGKLWTRSDMADVVAMVNKLPTAPPGAEYRLWCESSSKPGQMRMVGAFALDPEGFGMIVYKEDTEGPAYQVVEVVLQAPGSAVDQGRVVLLWRDGA
jgi:hypothetical protein